MVAFQVASTRGKNLTEGSGSFALTSLILMFHAGI